MIGIFDNIKYAKLSLKYGQLYKKSKPYPNIQIKNFLNIDIANKLYNSFPKYNDKKIWIEYSNVNTQNKKSMQDERIFPSPIRHFLRELNSRQFILFLETLTGIQGLTPDPYFMGGGLHIAQKNGYLNIHSDFNWHHKLQMYRRVNVLIYLTPNWKKNMGGELFLLGKKINKNKMVKYTPYFNSVVIFSTNSESYHGHPEPLKVKKGIYRRVLNLYYYTSSRPRNEKFAPHFTNYDLSNKSLKKSVTKEEYELKASPWCLKIGTDYKKLK